MQAASPLLERISRSNPRRPPLQAGIRGTASTPSPNSLSTLAQRLCTQGWLSHCPPCFLPCATARCPSEVGRAGASAYGHQLVAAAGGPAALIGRSHTEFLPSAVTSPYKYKTSLCDQLVSYNVGDGERAHAYLGLPLGPFLARRDGRSALRSVPAVVALHGTYKEGLKQAAALVDAEGKGKVSLSLSLSLSLRLSL